MLNVYLKLVRIRSSRCMLVFVLIVIFTTLSIWRLTDVINPPIFALNSAKAYEIPFTRTNDHIQNPTSEMFSFLPTGDLVTPTLFMPIVFGNFPSWQRIGDQPANVLKFYDIGVCNDRYVASTDKGVFTLSGANWVREIAIPEDVVLHVSFDPNSSCATIYVATLEHGVYRGDYSGSSWNWVDVYPLQGTIRAIAVRSSTVFIGGDFGVRWATNPSSGSSNWLDTNITTLVTGLTVRSDTTPHELYAAAWNMGVFENDGTNNSLWSSLGIPDDPLIYEVARSDQGMVAATQSGIFYWIGNGWLPTASLSQETTYTVAATDNALYAGQRHNAGVLVSYDGGQNWQFLNSGFDMNPPFGEFQVWSLSVENDGFLYAATTSGVWRWLGTP